MDQQNKQAEIEKAKDEEKLPEPAEAQSNHTETIDEMQDQVEKMEATLNRVRDEQRHMADQLNEIKDQHQTKASERTLSIYFHKLARSVQRELGSKSPVSPEKMGEESAFGEIFQTNDSKSLSDSAELLSKKLEIMGLNLIEFKKFKMKAQKQILALEQEQEKFVRTEYFRNEHQDYEIRMRNYTANQVGSLQQNVMQNHDLIMENQKHY